MDAETKPVGWICPDGSFLKCAWGYHLDAAIEAGEHHPEQNGWVHVNFKFIGSRFFQTVEPVSVMTQKQIDTLVRICIVVGQPLPFWVADVTIRG